MDAFNLLGFFTITWGEQHPVLAHYLARWLGIYITIMSLAVLFKTDMLKAVLQDLKTSPSLQFISGSLAILIGALIIAIHPTFEWGWSLFITLFGYLFLLRGILRIFFFREEVRIFNFFDKHKGFLYGWVILWLLIGLGLLWLGFYPEGV